MARCRWRHVCPSSQDNFTPPFASRGAIASSTRCFSRWMSSCGKSCGLATTPRMRNGCVTANGSMG